MPLYEFVCHEHGSFEVEQPMLAEHKANCPVCKKPARRIFTPLPVHWGFTLTESSHHEGNDDELISRKPSNEGAIRA